MQREVRLYRICWAMFCPSVNGPYCSLRPASRASDLAHCQPLVHYKVFALLIGGLWKSPNWISPQLASQDETGGGGGGAQQDASAAFSFLRSEWREIEKERGREYKGNENAICVRPFLFLPDMHFNCPPTLRGGHLRPRPVISRHFFLLCETLEFCILKLYFTL